jgi:hypothetical protein
MVLLADVQRQQSRSIFHDDDDPCPAACFNTKGSTSAGATANNQKRIEVDGDVIFQRRVYLVMANKQLYSVVAGARVDNKEDAVVYVQFRKLSMVLLLHQVSTRKHFWIVECRKGDFLEQDGRTHVSTAANRTDNPHIG